MRKVLRVLGYIVSIVLIAFGALLTVVGLRSEKVAKRQWYAECEQENKLYQCDALWDMARHHVRR